MFDYTKSKLNHQRKQPQEIETNWNALQLNIWYLAIINGKWKSKFDKNTETMKCSRYESLPHLCHSPTVEWYEKVVNLTKKQKKRYSYQFLLYLSYEASEIFLSLCELWLNSYTPYIKHDSVINVIQTMQTNPVYFKIYYACQIPTFINI